MNNRHCPSGRQKLYRLTIDMKQCDMVERMENLIDNLLITVGRTLTWVQVCDLPPATISDIGNEHNLTVHWTENHTHRDCALYTGGILQKSWLFPMLCSFQLYDRTLSPSLFIRRLHLSLSLPQVDPRVGAGILPLTWSFSGMFICKVVDIQKCQESIDCNYFTGTSFSEA